MSNSGNAYAGRNLKRMEIVYKDIDIKFAVNPTDYTQTKPNKATLTQTKGGAWIDAWGAGIVEFTIKGVTGFNAKSSSDTGYSRWKELENLFDTLYDTVKDGEEITDDELIKFYNHTDNVNYYCYPTQSGIELNRSASKPHLYQYTINLWGVRKMGTPPIVVEGKIGSPTKQDNNGTNTITSKNQSSAYQSGKKYLSKSRAFDSDSDVTTFTNTKTKTLLGIQNDCLYYMNELAPIIGGRNGRISPATGYQCSRVLTIQSTGTISNVNGFSGYDLKAPEEDKYDILLSEVKFRSNVSVETYNMCTKIHEYSPEVLSTEYCEIKGMPAKQKIIQAVGNNRDFDSTLYELILLYQPKSIISKSEVNHLRIILLESMMIYIELYKIYNQTEELSTTLTMTNMEILINNIRAMIMYFDFNYNRTNQLDRKDISAELRKLEKIITQIRVDVVDYL